LGVDGVELPRVAVLSLNMRIYALGEHPALGRRGVFGVLGMLMVDKLEEMLPVPADLLVDLSDVLHLAYQDLLG
jgi:hypothetical protein